MKNFTLTLVLFLVLGAGFAYTQSSLLIGPGMSYRVDDQVEGGHFRLYFALPKWLSFGPEFTYYIPTSYEGQDDQNNDVTLRRELWSGDFNLHVDIKIKDFATVYPLLGVNITSLYEEGIPGPDGLVPTTPVDENYFGFNVGGGIHLFPRQIGPFFEYKYTLGDLQQPVVTAGINFRIRLKNDDRDWVPPIEKPRQK